MYKTIKSLFYTVFNPTYLNKFFSILIFILISSTMMVVITGCEDEYENKAEKQEKWIQKANYQGAGVVDAIAFTINGKIYVGMGKNGFYANDTKKDLWEYNPLTDKWTQKSTFPGTTNACYFIANEKAYVVATDQYYGTGDKLYRKMWEYAPASDTWIQKSGLPIDNNIWEMFSFSINNKGYVGGSINWNYAFYSFCYEYDPKNDTWKKCADPPCQNSGYFWCSSLDGKGYLGGGIDISYNTVRSFWMYNADKDEWIQKADYPACDLNNTLITCYDGIAFNMDNTLYAGLGGANSDYGWPDFYTNEIYKYNSETNSWQLAFKFTERPRHGSIAIVCNGKLYIGLGRECNYNDCANYLLDFWEYHP